MYIFPRFSSVPVFLITFSSTLVFFAHIINVPGIIPILALMYLFLQVSHKVANIGYVTLIILTGVSICEIRLIYEILPRILSDFSNLLLLALSHVFLVHHGVILFIEFGLDKLPPEDRDLFTRHSSPVLLISYPVTIATVWSLGACSSLGLRVEWLPFMFQLTLFCLLQVVLSRRQQQQQHRNAPAGDSAACIDTGTDTETETETGVAICMVQVGAGVLAQLLVSIYCAITMATGPHRWSWSTPQILVDHASLWALGVLLAALLPCRASPLQSAKLAEIPIKHVVMASGACCYGLLLPVLHVHGIELHSVWRVVLVEMLVLGVALPMVTVLTATKSVLAVMGCSAGALAVSLARDMPWGIQVVPRASSLLLESLYGCIVLMSVAGMAALHALARSASRSCTGTGTGAGAGAGSPHFQISILVLVTVFHGAEWSLYFTGLAPPPFVLVSGVLVVLLETSLSSRGRLWVPVSALIGGQLLVKGVVLALHCSMGPSRVAIPPISVLACLVTGTVLHHAARQRAPPSLPASLLEPIVLFASLLILRDPIMIAMVHGITREEMLTRPSVLQCLVLALALNLASHWPTKLTGPSKIRASALLVSACALVNMTLPAGVLLCGFYAACLHRHEQRWVPVRVAQRVVVLASSAVLVLGGLMSGLCVWDWALSLALGCSTLAMLELARQPSVRTFKRHLIAHWLLGSLLALLVTMWAPHAGLRLVAVATHHATVTGMLAWRRRRLATLQDRLEVSDHMATALARLQVLSMLQCLLGGLSAARFAFSTPGVLALPALLWLVLRLASHRRHGNSPDTDNTCRCEWRAVLVSRRIDPVALAVSSIALLLFAGTVQQSPLLGPAVPAAAAASEALQLDIARNVRASIELVLATFLAVCHAAMLGWAAVAVAPHECAVSSTGCTAMPNIDYWLVGYTGMVPASLGFVFCSTGLSSTALAVVSAAAGIRQLIM